MQSFCGEDLTGSPKVDKWNYWRAIGQTLAWLRSGLEVIEMKCIIKLAPAKSDSPADRRWNQPPDPTLSGQWESHLISAMPHRPSHEEEEEEEEEEE